MAAELTESSLESSNLRNLLQLGLKLAACQKSKGVDGSLVLELRFSCFHDLIEDLTTETIEEDTTFILRVSGILHHINVEK